MKIIELNFEIITDLNQVSMDLLTNSDLGTDAINNNELKSAKKDAKEYYSLKLRVKC